MREVAFSAGKLSCFFMMTRAGTILSGRFMKGLSPKIKWIWFFPLMVHRSPCVRQRLRKNTTML